MRRHVAPAFTGLCLAALIAAPAAAGTESGPTVTFNGGGLGVLICSSNPDRDSISTTAGTWINVVNRTGFAGTLHVGSTDIPFADNEGKAISLAPGHYQMQMRPSCGLNLSNAGTVGVEVAARASSLAATTSSAGTSTATSSPHTLAAGASTPPAAVPPPASTTHPDKVPAAPAETADPVLSLPGTPEDPELDAATLTDAISGTGDVVAVQPYTPVMAEPQRASRLLVLVATICVVGVTIAAIRAIMAQRAGRPSTA